MSFLRILSAIGFVAVLTVITADIRRKAGGWKQSWVMLGAAVRHTVAGARAHDGRTSRTSLLRVRMVITLATFVLGLALVLTGFIPVILLGEHLTGILLIIHVTVAPFFAVGLAAVALLWSSFHRFTGRDWQVVRYVAGNRSPSHAGIHHLLLRTWYWLMLVLSLPLILTVILEMFPLFGTEGEEMLIRIHAYSALFLAITTLGYSYLSLLSDHHKRHQGLKEE